MTETVARLHIALADSDPPIWRRVDMPVDANLKMLHDVIQAAMGWLDCHLWEFAVGDKRFGLPDPDWPDDGLSAARSVRLGALIDRGVGRLDYAYDMGDNWEHLITIESVGTGEPGVKYPRYVDGARRAPPEDVGGMPGYEEFVRAIADPGHPEHGEAMEWHFECYGEAFDPETIDALAAKLRIGGIAKRRAAGKVSRAKAESR